MTKHPLFRKARIIMLSLFGLAGAIGALWWAIFALKPYELTTAELQARYSTPAVGAVELGFELKTAADAQTSGHALDLSFRSFDGDPVVGRITYPSDPALATQKFPLLLALHGLGRTHLRWWQPELRGRPTIESTDRVTALALQQGYAVLALDARGHGARKGPEPVHARTLLRNLHWWGEREPYENMIINTVRDYRVVLDWAVKQASLDAKRISAIGYSKGAQSALLLAATDPRVRSVAAMVPPYVDQRVAAVAPIAVAPLLAETRVWLLTANDDEYASASENAALFAAIPGEDKKHLQFPGGHVLPPNYVDSLVPWFKLGANTDNMAKPDPA